MTLLGVLLAVVSAVGLSGGIAGFSRGWAFVEKSLVAPDSKFAPAMRVCLELGWWNSTTLVESGWVPAEVEDSSEAARVLGVATILALTAGVVASLYMLLVAVFDACGLTMPARIRTRPTDRWRYTGLVGGFCMLLTLCLYLGLMLGAHDEIRRKFGSAAKVWPRPDWASASAFLGSSALLGLTYHLVPAEYESMSYMPL